MNHSAYAFDPRSPWQKISRRQLRLGMKRLDIPFRIEQTHAELVNALVQMNIQPDQITKFVPVVVKTPTGDEVKFVPEEKQRKPRSDNEEMRRAAIFEERIEKTKENLIAEDSAKAKAEIEALKAQVEKLTTRKPETDPLKMKFMAQRKWLKEHGVELKKGDNAKELIQGVLDEKST